MKVQPNQTVPYGTISPPALLQMRVDQLGDQAGPTGLVRCANPATVVSVKVFKELQIVAEIWVGLQFVVVAEYRPPAISVA